MADFINVEKPFFKETPILIHQFLDKPLGSNPGKVAVICGNQQCTYNELVDTMNIWAHALIAVGIKPRKPFMRWNKVEARC